MTDETKDSEGSLGTKAEPWKLLAWRASLLVFLLWLLIGFGAPIIAHGLSIDRPTWETGSFLGGSFGVVNSLFSALALVGVIVAILLQREDLRNQQIELKATREEMRLIRQVHKESEAQLAEHSRVMRLSSTLEALQGIERRLEGEEEEVYVALEAIRFEAIELLTDRVVKPIPHARLGTESLESFLRMRRFISMSTKLQEQAHAHLKDLIEWSKDLNNGSTSDGLRRVTECKRLILPLAERLHGILDVSGMEGGQYSDSEHLELHWGRLEAQLKSLDEICRLEDDGTDRDDMVLFRKGISHLEGNVGSWIGGVGRRVELMSEQANSVRHNILREAYHVEPTEER